MIGAGGLAKHYRGTTTVGAWICAWLVYAAGPLAFALRGARTRLAGSS